MFYPYFVKQPGRPILRFVDETALPESCYVSNGGSLFLGRLSKISKEKELLSRQFEPLQDGHYPRGPDSCCSEKTVRKRHPGLPVFGPVPDKEKE